MPPIWVGMDNLAPRAHPATYESQTRPNSDSLLRAALTYAERGWHVFVLSSTKTPLRNCKTCVANHTTPAAREACDHLTCHGFYAATTDPTRIALMFKQHPYGLLAVRTGAVSGLAVVDFDFKTWEDFGTPARTDAAHRTMTKLDKRGLLPATLMSRTGSGGLHLFYSHPGGQVMSGARKYGDGVDSKADGGYIVAAPSVAPSGPYDWTPDGRQDHPLTLMPDGLAALVRAPVDRRTAFGRSGRIGEASVGSTRARLRGLLTAVLEAPEGTRNDRLHWAASRAGEMVAAGEVDECTVVTILQRAALDVGLSPSEVGDARRGTIGSGLHSAYSATSVSSKGGAAS